MMLRVTGGIMRPARASGRSFLHLKSEPVHFEHLKRECVQNDASLLAVIVADDSRYGGMIGGPD
ncbi:hypothetical protein NGR_b07300 (plasmid) [Sinorhizobium fredii NGR234]|uniref:Uncharacterized protein n=1 Tax=Sinorhizobium fredii (strain NBRC 101917 / NGR234) TaxID=394 RepID=C3KQ30_SINFN|nr:hypothetical protein NGR_b07300 [Sinorhizobium fredii NGR234]